MEKETKILIKDYIKKLINEISHLTPDIFELINMNLFIDELTKISIEKYKQTGDYIIEKNQIISIYKKTLNSSINDIVNSLVDEGLAENNNDKIQLTEKGKEIKKLFKKSN